MLGDIVRALTFGATVFAAATALFDGHEGEFQQRMEQALINDLPKPEPAPIPMEPTLAPPELKQEISVSAAETPTEVQTTGPTLFCLPAGVHFDCVLLKYEPRGQSNATRHDVLQKIGGGRVITYPDNYVPMIVHKDKVEVVKKAMQAAGCETSMMPLSEGLNWPK